MRSVHVAGAFTTPFGKSPSTPLRVLAAAAVEGVLADAGGTPDAVDAVVFANMTEGSLTGQHSIRGQIALEETGLRGLPVVNVENACAGGSTAVHVAAMQIESGRADVVLALGAEKLTHPDKARSFAAIGAALDVETTGAGDATSASPFMHVYAAMARDYQERTGATVEDFAAAAVKSHAHGALNPNAQYRDTLTVEEVLGSRTIVDPLRLLMCSPIGDGAAALLLASDEGLARLDADAVRLAASVVRSGRRTSLADRRDPAVTVAAREAYAAAGIAPADVDVAEVHDAAAPGELIALEETGLAAAGAAPAMLRAGETSLGGRLPVNTGGGLQSRGHPVGATGCAQLVELCDQLRGRARERQVDGAQIALAENGGGWIGGDPAAVAITVLAR